MTSAILDTLSAEERTQLDNLLPIRGLLAWKPGANAPVGLIEHSFAMDFSPDRMLILWSGKARSLVGTLSLDAEDEAADQMAYYAKKHPDWRFEIVDPLSPDAPIAVDIARWLRFLVGGGPKFEKRNALFQVKDEATNSGAAMTSEVTS
ncbi:MAG: hypothetical protein K2X45_07975 [Phreatobacter sp.]|nr:hypothetical protein [Phreatobacter sp.]